MKKEVEVTSLYLDYVFGAEYDAIVEVGGRYSGKSYNSEIEEASNLMSKKDYKLLIIQELDKGSSDGYYAGLVDKIEQFEHEKAYNITGSSTKITNNLNGNSVLFRGYKTEQQKKDVKNIDQVTKIVVEEGEWMTFDDFLSLIQQLRGKVEADRRLDILLNPVNEHCFVNTELIQKPPDKVLEYFPNSNRPKVFEKSFKIHSVDGEELSINILVVLSTHHDNPYLTNMQRASIEVLRDTDPEKYKQLGEARFIKPGGAYFREFDRDVHVIDPFPIPKHWDRYTAMDYGFDQYASIWIAVDEDGNNYVYKICHKDGLIISEAAELWHEITENDKVVVNYAPPDMKKRSNETGKDMFELFLENNLVYTKADNSRVNGWFALKELIRIYEKRDIYTGDTIKTAKLKIFNTCPELIKCMESVLKDERNPNDVAKEPHDITHLPDALRYFAIMRQGVSIKPTTTHNRDSFFQPSYNTEVNFYD